jgi:hypothetical protein
MTALHLFPCEVCFVGKEHVFRFHFSDNIKVSLHPRMAVVLTLDDLIHLDLIWRDRLENDYRISGLHADTGLSHVTSNFVRPV